MFHTNIKEVKDQRTDEQKQKDIKQYMKYQNKKQKEISNNNIHKNNNNNNN